MESGAQSNRNDWFPSPRLAVSHAEANDPNSLETILSLIPQMETTLRGLKQLRRLVEEGEGLHLLQTLIDEAETKLAEIKRKVIQ